MPSLAELQRSRAFACRLTADRALESLEEAAGFLEERGLLTLTPDCSLPSLFGACHEEPYKPGSRGFGLWPKTKYWWGVALAEADGVTGTSLHRGKRLFVSNAFAAAVDPLCRAELAKAEDGGHGPEASRLLAHLAAAGPSETEDLKVELGLDAKTLRAVRSRLERVGALVVRGIEVEIDGGHRHSSELYRWDQLFRDRPERPGGLEELVALGIRSAVVVPENEVSKWFSWRVPGALVEALVVEGRLFRPEPGWLAAAP